MVGEYFGMEISITTSLGIILAILGAGIGASIVLPPETLRGDDGDEESS
jgi:hypothetical protein